MTTAVLIGIDLVAIATLVFGLYYPRHRRRDLVVAFLGVNVGVLAVSIVLASTPIGLGIGLGLFGVLSIIRLRSTEISQIEIAYYFSALAIGLISGLATGVEPLLIGLVALVVVAMLVGDHPALFARTRMQRLRLDAALPIEADARAAAEALLEAPVQRIEVIEVDQVNDWTLVEVRFRVPTGASHRAPGAGIWADDAADPSLAPAPVEAPAQTPTGTRGDAGAVRR